MSKIITYLFTLIIFIFFPLTVFASSKVELASTNNGHQINTKIHFEEGFVGGIDLTLQLDGNVSITKFNFNDTFTKNNYYTNYTYNAENHTLSLKVTTGGVNANHNLLNQNKEVSLGQIVVSNNSEENISYKLEATTLTIIDNSWKSTTLKDIITPNQDFTYQVSSESSNNSSSNSHKNENNNDLDNNESNNNSEPDNKEDNSSSSTPETKPSNQTKPSNNSSSGNKNETSSNSTNSNSSTNEPDQIIDSDSNNQTEDNSSENNPESNNNINNFDNKEEPKIKEKSVTKKTPIIIVGVSTIAVSGIIYCIFKLKK